jgi:hypothetical protein
MKWGVRRYQNKDGSLTNLGRRHYGKGEKANSNDFVIKKGTTFHRVAGSANSGYTNGVFATYRTDDRELYKGVLGRMRLNPKSSVTKGDKRIYDVSLTAGKDIRIPSKESRLELFRSFTNNKRNRADVEKIIAKQGKLKNFSFDKIKNDKDLTKAYQYFNEAMGRGTGHGNKVIKRFYEHGKKKGYDAVVDENDVRLSTFKAKAPLIFFDTNDSISKSSTRKLKAGEIVESYDSSIGKKFLRDVVYRKGKGNEKVVNLSKNFIKDYEKTSKDKLSKYSKNYSLNDLSYDWYYLRLNTKQIQKLNQYMINHNCSHDDAVKVLNLKQNVIADKVLSKFHL